MEGITVVWDFDQTLIQLNSDTYIPGFFSDKFSDYIRQGRREGLQWTELMAKVLKEMHTSGISPRQIVTTAAEIAVDPHTLALIRQLDELGVIQYIVSYANEVYINAFLQHHELTQVFYDRVHTNKAYWEKDCLIIEPHTPSAFPHLCPLCPVNLCKGKVLRSLGLTDSNISTVFYIGDGSGDYCPSQTLPPSSVVYARSSFPLSEMCETNPISAKVVNWRDWGELKTLVLEEARLLSQKRTRKSL